MLYLYDTFIKNRLLFHSSYIFIISEHSIKVAPYFMPYLITIVAEFPKIWNSCHLHHSFLLWLCTNSTTNSIGCHFCFFLAQLGLPNLSLSVHLYTSLLGPLVLINIKQFWFTTWYQSLCNKVVKNPILVTPILLNKEKKLNFSTS